MQEVSPFQEMLLYLALTAGFQGFHKLVGINR